MKNIIAIWQLVNIVITYPEEILYLQCDSISV